MRFKYLLLALGVGTSVVSGVASAFADERHESTVTLDSIPAAARQTIVREAHGAPVASVEIEKKSGKTLYEAHVKQGTEVIGIVVDADGKLIGKHSERKEHEHEHHER
jgi:hypothetical protein